jgi:DNA-binding SARP family transcriptional activator/ATP/maltotriose-dependent transcriptional regulator MalT
MEVGMTACDGAKSVPDFGSGVVRQRLLSQLSAAGGRPGVIFGPSGSGKSVLAAQFAREFPGTVVWLSADGVSLGAPEVSDLVLRDLGSVLAKVPAGRGSNTSQGDHVAEVVDAAKTADKGDGVCIVIDDLGSDLGQDHIEFLDRMGMALWRAGARLVVTTRSVERWSPKARCEWCLVDGHDLALTLGEAQDLAHRLGPSMKPEDVSELREATSGHAALYSAMVAQASKYGLDATSSRAVNLDAWLDRVVSDVRTGDLHALQLATALKAGTELDLRALGIVDPALTLRRIGAMVPLVQVAAALDGILSFRVHDIVDGYLSERGLAPGGDVRSKVVGLLTERPDYSRACELLVRYGDDDAARAWLAQYGGEAFSAGHVSALSRLLQSMSVSALMSEAETLVLWSRVCYETGRYEESLAKAKAARLLAEHDRDYSVVRGSIAQILMALRYLGRQDDADTLAEEVTNSRADYVDDVLLAEALFCIGCGRVLRGDLVAAEPPFRAVLELSDGNADSRHIARLAQNSLSVFPAITRGDFLGSRSLLSKMMDDPADSPSTRVMIKGNMALCLVECGRNERAESLMRALIKDTEQYGLDLYAGAYFPVLGTIRYALGDPEGGIVEIRRGITYSLNANDTTEAALNRVPLSQVLRAIGRVEEALTEAEQSLDALSIQDAMGFRRLAAFEVAACLLAGGDATAARNWVESQMDTGPAANCFHTIRAAMILAECDRREGDTAAALGRLREFSDYIKSENGNYQVAVYARSFPSILGLLSMTIGPAALPSHMLRMIPPESSERILVETHSWLADDIWRALGTRLLGVDEFARFLARDGLPVCHVRFFGGLEVSIGGRSIREKDWRKRKARLLFAMLVLRRGQDVPRDQLFDYLFPEMDPERAKNNLYVIWSTMKSVLMGEGAKGSPFPYFEAVGGVCRAVRDNIRCDVDDFDKLLANARQHEAAGELGDALQNYERLSSLYRGELLPGDVYDDWFAELRDHYRITFVDAMLAAGAILMNADDPGNALVYARRAIQMDPLREDLYQVALRCQIAAGQRSGAIDTYLQCRSKLSEDLGLDPSAETRALYDQILVMEDKPRITPLDPLVD